MRELTVLEEFSDGSEAEVTGERRRILLERIRSLSPEDKAALAAALVTRYPRPQNRKQRRVARAKAQIAGRKRAGR